MRLALGGILHETNTFSTVPTTYADFRRADGDDILESLPSYRDALDIVPIFVAHATPSGRVTREAFDRLLLELIDGIRAAMPVDGLLLELHGAMEVEEIGDGETAILEAVRNLVGPAPIVATTLDLHANLAPICVELSDIVLAYRTAPHRDVDETRRRGVALLRDAVESARRPVTTMVKLPLLVAGEAAVTEVEPAKSLFQALPEFDRRPGVSCSSILIGCAWTDSPHTRVSAVVSGTDIDACDSVAVEIAGRVWAARRSFHIDSQTAALREAIDLAAASTKQPVFISDSGDNTTAGAAGDLPTVLRYLVERGVHGALVAGIHDPQSVAHCFEAGVGGEVELTIGARLDSVHDSPYRCRATVSGLDDEHEFPPRALIQVGPAAAVLQTNRRPFTELRHFETLGVDPESYRIIVVKEGYLFPELRDYARHHIMALTSGFGDQRLEELPYRTLTRPIFPLDPDVSWEPGNE
jgi:microcystin degradation protein MlrC